jgi:hypothetical protein
MELIKKCGNNIPDNKIFKASLVKAFSGSIIDTAIENTMSTEKVVLLDIMRAFDSLEWDVLEDLLESNLTRKIDSETAKDLVSQYMTIIKNRELYYNNHLIEISKGIPTGLPSSNLVFTLALEEILYRWFNDTKYVNQVDFRMNVYVDDIYLKIINIKETSNVVNSLIAYLESYKLNVNKYKSRADENLNLTIINKLKETDYYLGIPFTRNIRLYGNLILNEFRKNKLDLTWKQIYDKLISDEPDEDVRVIVGFMNYKLKPFLGSNPDENTFEVNKDKIIEFIWENYASEELKKIYLVYSMILLLTTIMVFLLIII